MHVEIALYVHMHCFQTKQRWVLKPIYINVKTILVNDYINVPGVHINEPDTKWYKCNVTLIRCHM